MGEFVKEIKDNQLRTRAEEVVHAFEETYYNDKHFSKEEIKRLRQQIREIGRLRVNTQVGPYGGTGTRYLISVLTQQLTWQERE